MMLDCSTRFCAKFGDGLFAYFVRIPSRWCLDAMRELRVAGATVLELEVDDGPAFSDKTILWQWRKE